MNNNNFRTRIKYLVATIILLLIILIAWSIYSSTRFHIVSTDPSTSDVATVSPYFKINYNKPLSKAGLVVVESPYIGSYQVEGKTLTINISKLLNQSTTYSVDIKYVSDTSGSKLTNTILKFKPKFVSPSDLSKNQQNAILKKQAQAAVNQPPSFSGTSALLNLGLSTSQVQVFEQGVENFAQAHTIQFSSVVIDASTATTGPNTGSGIFDVMFSFSMANVTYNATLSYAGLETAQLNIYNTQGTALYQYGSLNSTSNTGSADSNQ